VAMGVRNEGAWATLMLISTNRGEIPISTAEETPRHPERGDHRLPALGSL
jgi:hypothetical protein